MTKKATPILAQTYRERACYEWGRRLGAEETTKKILETLGVYEAIDEAIRQLQEDD